MGQLANVIRSEEKKYLLIHDALLILKHFFNESGRTVGKFVGHIKISDTLCTFEKDHYYNFHIIHDDTEIFSELSEYLLSGKVDTTGCLPAIIQNKYWKKAAFLEFEAIKNTGITSEVIEHFLNYRYYKSGHDSFTPFKDFNPTVNIPTISKAPKPIHPVQGSFDTPSKKHINTAQELLDVSPSIQQILQNTEYKNQEIEQLKADLAHAQERIKELKLQQETKERLSTLQTFIGESQKDSKILEQQEKINMFSKTIDQQFKEIAHLRERLGGVEALREKFKIPETPEQEIVSSKTRNSVSILIAVLCELGNINMTQPHGEPNKLILDTAEQLGAKLGKDFVGKWLKLAKENIK